MTKPIPIWICFFLVFSYICMGRIYITYDIQNKTSETTTRCLCCVFSHINDIYDIHWVLKFSVSFFPEQFILFLHDLKINIFFDSWNIPFIFKNWRCPTLDPESAYCSFSFWAAWGMELKKTSLSLINHDWKSLCF